MTLDSTLSKALYQGNGSATQFPFSFKVWEPSQVRVTVAGGSRESTDVTAQCRIDLTNSGGVVTYPLSGKPLSENFILSITRNMPFIQDIDLVSASRFDAQVIEDGLDQATAERQQMREELSRAVILPPTSEETPADVVEDIYAARDQAGQSASEAATSAQAAAQSAEQAEAAAHLAGECREHACRCADRAEQARDVALEQTATVNTLMETELAKINTIVAINQDDQQTAVAKAKAWAESPEDVAVETNEGEPEYSARHWALKSSQLLAGDASKVRKGVVQIGQGIEVEQGIISVPLATDSTPGLVRPDNMTCAADAAGILRGISMLCNTRTVLTESGEFIVPVSGWYKRTCIGGGGGGGRGGSFDTRGGTGGRVGGTTEFDGIVTSGGAGGGGAGYLAGGGGGEAGHVVTDYKWMKVGDVIEYKIGAGGGGEVMSCRRPLPA